MTSVNEQLVRDYLELIGFCVRQGRKYSVIARQKAAWEEADLLGANLAVWATAGLPGVAAMRPRPGLWGMAELARVPSVAVSVRGWHSDRFTAQMLAASPELLRFAARDAMEAAKVALHTSETAAVLFLPDLPAAKAERDAAIDFLVAHGVQGIVLFRTMLLDLLDRVDVKKSYEKSDVLQLLRILKTHRLVQSRQMVLGDWAHTHGRRQRKTAGPGKTIEAKVEDEPPKPAGEGTEEVADTSFEPLDDGPDALAPEEDTLLPPETNEEA